MLLWGLLIMFWLSKIEKNKSLFEKGRVLATIKEKKIEEPMPMDWWSGKLVYKKYKPK